MSQSMKVQWSDALKTGNRAIDNQHKYLIDIINDLAGAIETGATPQALKKIVNLLQYYTEWHFCNEEGCMDKLKCPVAAKNKDAHAQFIATFLEFRRELEAGGDSNEIATRMYKTLTAWLVQHIQGIDSQLAYVSGEGPVPAAPVAPAPEPEPAPVAIHEPMPEPVETPAPLPEPGPSTPSEPEASAESKTDKKWWRFGH